MRLSTRSRADGEAPRLTGPRGRFKRCCLCHVAGVLLVSPERFARLRTRAEEPPIMPEASTGFRQTLSASPTGETPLKLAVQRSGRLTQDTLDLLHAIGLQFESYGQRLFSHCRNFPLSILYGRDDDIPGYIGLGTVDLGIVGRNLIHEEDVAVEELAPLGFGYCELVVATLRDAPYTEPEELLARAHRDVVSGLGAPVLSRAWAATRRSSPSVDRSKWHRRLGLADAIVELTATGSTLLLNDLRPIATILESEAVLAAHPDAMADPAKRANIDRLLMRIDAVRAAKRYKYLMMNAPSRALPAIRAVVPGSEGADDRAARRPGMGRRPHGRRRGRLLGVDRTPARGRRHRDPRSSLEKLLLLTRFRTLGYHWRAPTAVCLRPSHRPALLSLLHTEDDSCLRASLPGPCSMPRGSSGRRSIIFRSTPAKRRRSNKPAREVRLDWNESPYGPSPKALAALAEIATHNRYPEFDAWALREALGTLRRGPGGHIVAGAGLDNVLETLMFLLIEPGDRVIISEPTFMVYELLVRGAWRRGRSTSRCDPIFSSTRKASSTRSTSAPS